MKCPFCGRDIPDDAARCDFCERELPRATMWVEMPLCYTHVCEACGAEMTVYDSSYWTEVACTSCGKLFMADPPRTLSG
jgi:hypothetical protein